MTDTLYCEQEPLREFVRNVFLKLGAGQDIAEEVASHLVGSNLSGHDSHGVIRLPQYVQQAFEGEIVPAARPEVARKSGATLLVDAHRGMGHYTTLYALDQAMKLARKQGAAVAAIRHSTHIGRVGEYPERAAEQGFVSIVTVGASGPSLGGQALHGTHERFLGANPWAMGFPAKGRPPIVFDGSTTMIAEGKVRVARDKGTEVPPHCVIDADGRPTVDPHDFYRGGALLPLGSPIAAHKGFGLALASALLGALAMIDDPEPSLIGAGLYDKEADPKGRVAGVFLIVIDPEAFGGAEGFGGLVADNAAAAKRVPPAPGVDEVLLPGEFERKMRDQRRRGGIPIPRVTWHSLTEVAERFHVPMPTPRGG